jgi:ribosomal peptide maturation radical SAM protein 1
MSDIALVQMPFAGVERPSIALGLISSTLKAKGLSVSTMYSNLAWSERFGVDAHVLIEQSALDDLVGEWVFSAAAFPELGDAGAEHAKRCSQKLNRYFGELERAVLEYRGLPNSEALLRELRDMASSFVKQEACRILDTGSRVVACTSMFQQQTASLALLREIKQRAPEVVTVMGGSNCTGPMGLAMHRSFDWVDYTATGEVDQEAGDIFSSFLELRSPHEDPDNLPTHILGRQDRQRKRDPEEIGHSTTDLTTIATPDYDDYFSAIRSSSIGKYIAPSIPFEGSRGCWWGAKQHCSFCGLNANGMAYRLKPAEKVLHEIDYLASRYDLSQLSAVDNIIDHTYFRTVLPKLTEDERPFELFYETKANLDEKQVEILAESGTRWIQPGIESLHDESLKLLKKGTTAAINLRLLKYCMESGVHPVWNLLVGLPGEQVNWLTEMREQFPILHHLPPPQGVSPVRFDRFSPYFEQRDEYGLELTPFNAYRIVYPLEGQDLFDLAYFFEANEGGPIDEVTMSRELSELTTALQEWIRHYWFEDQRPELIMLDNGEEITIRDTRAVTGTEEHRLVGVRAALYRLMRKPTTSAKILTELSKEGWDLTPEEVDQNVTQLHADKLVWQMGGRIMAIACQPSRREMPSLELPPWGQVNLAGLFKDRRSFIHWKAG